MFTSTKMFGPISTGHRQYLDEGHCSFVHGYGRKVQLTFAAKELDHKGWVMDFGGLKQVRKWLEDEWDHRTLIHEDDPALNDLKDLEYDKTININIMRKPYGPGIELSCLYVYDNLTPMIKEATDGRVWIQKVEIWEHENNSAAYHHVPEVIYKEI